MEWQQEEKSQFALIDPREFALARELVKSVAQVGNPSAVQIPESVTLAQEMRRSYPSTSELDKLLQKPTAKQVLKYPVFTRDLGDDHAEYERDNFVAAGADSEGAVYERALQDPGRLEGTVSIRDQEGVHGSKRGGEDLQFGKAQDDQQIHYKPFLQPHTETVLGDCPQLNLCPSMETCKYVHYIQEDPVLPLCSGFRMPNVQTKKRICSGLTRVQRRNGSSVTSATLTSASWASSTS